MQRPRQMSELAIVEDGEPLSKPLITLLSLRTTGSTRITMISVLAARRLRTPALTRPPSDGRRDGGRVRERAWEGACAVELLLLLVVIVGLRGEGRNERRDGLPSVWSLLLRMQSKMLLVRRGREVVRRE